MQERIIDSSEATAGSPEAPHQQRGVYEPPQLKVIGTVSELTWGSNSSADSDGIMPGSAI